MLLKIAVVISFFIITVNLLRQINVCNRKNSSREDNKLIYLFFSYTTFLLLVLKIRYN